MKKVSKDITAQTQYSDAMQVYGPALMVVEDTSSMNMTVTLQVRLDGTWFSAGITRTSEGVANLTNGCGLYYRVGCHTGDFTSGTATASLVKPGRVT